MPELSPSAAPEFVDAASCKAWLEHVPLANVGVAQRQLLGQLVELNRFPISAANRLAVMESLREAVNFVQIEQANAGAHRLRARGADAHVQSERAHAAPAH